MLFFLQVSHDVCLKLLIDKPRGGLKGEPEPQPGETQTERVRESEWKMFHSRHLSFFFSFFFLTKKQRTDLPHVEVADDYSRIHLWVVTAEIATDLCVTPVKNCAVEHRRITAALNVGEQLCPREVPLRVVAHKTWKPPTRHGPTIKHLLCQFSLV